MASQQVAPESPVAAIQHWLLEDWDGPLKPSDVMAIRGEDADERDAWYFVVVLPEPEGETWDAEEFALLQRAIRDKALEVELPYPWYVVPRSSSEADDIVPEDDADLPDSE